MAAPLGFKTFATGDVLTAADTNGYLMQGVWVFADAAARTAAVTSPEEGNMSFLKDTNSTEYYSGAAWVAVAGAVFSPATTYLSADVTLTAANTFYDGPGTGSLVNGGVYLISTSALIIPPNANEIMTLRLWDGTTTYAETSVNVNGSFWGGTGSFGCAISPFVYTAGSTNALKISAATSGSAGTMKISRNVSNNSATSNKATFITAQRIS
jgi:hypothetical protein